jgi:hypothetical protein
MGTAAVARQRIAYLRARMSATEVYVSIIDRQRIAAVEGMEALGYSFDGVAWNAPASDASTASAIVAEADKMHTLLVMRADALAGCTEGSEEDWEFKAIAEAVTAYEEKRWTNGRDGRGMG